MVVNSANTLQAPCQLGKHVTNIYKIYKQIYKTSLRLHELKLIEFCEDYYKGFYPEIYMKEKLQNYSYSLQPIIRYLYQNNICL